MLVKVLNLDLKSKTASVYVSLPKRVYKKDAILDYEQEKVCEKASEALMNESKKIIACEFIKKPAQLSNRYADSTREFTLEVKLSLKEKDKPVKSKTSASSSLPPTSKD